MSTSLSQQQVTIGRMRLLIEDGDFLHGYHHGYETFSTFYAKGDRLDTTHLLFVLRNGWNAGHSDMWTTGYIMGWLAAFYECEEGQFALLRDDAL